MRSLALAALTILVASAAEAETRPCGEGPCQRRIVTLGGAVTESVFALGAGDEVVAVDVSSLHPAATRSLPQVGYYRTLAAEGILSLRPTLVLATAEAGPPAVLDQLRAAGVEVVSIPAEPSLAGARARIEVVARHLGSDEAGAALLASIDEALERARPKVACVRKAPPRVLFLFAQGGGNVSVAGGETAADAIVSLAGGRNAVQGFRGYRPLAAEAAVQAAPDVIVTTTRALGTMGGRAGLDRQPGLSLTPAVRNGRVVVLDDLLLLGFGPRTGEAVATLAQALGEGRCGAD